ncbi:MAG TPA: carbohydrate ABC transporter permease, partial [Thermoanaerobaculia bacterium]|nr:carbohydrate ABC transporter permease [Thermoanaerobaculia bacterium]
MTGRRAVLGVAVAALVVWSLAPAAWQVLTALKPDRDITRTPTVYLPDPATWKHVEALWERKPFGVYLANSALVAGAATGLSLLLAAPAASALGRLPARRRRGVLSG